MENNGTLSVRQLKVSCNKYPNGLAIIEQLCTSVHSGRRSGKIHDCSRLDPNDSAGKEAIKLLTLPGVKKTLEKNHDLAILFSNGDCNTVVVAVNRHVAKEAIKEICGEEAANKAS